MEKSQAPAKTFVDLETIAVGKGPSMEAVMERWEEQTAMSAPVPVSTLVQSY